MIKTVLLFIIVSFSGFHQPVLAQFERPELHYIVSMPDPAKHRFHIEFRVKGLNQDTLVFKMPEWMPGYYQLMNYAGDVEDISARSRDGDSIPMSQINNNTWRVTVNRNDSFTISYDVKSEKKFVAYSFLDTTHAYIAPANNFLYIEGLLNLPVTVTITENAEFQWNKIATGLEKISGEHDTFIASNFDILYDSPILFGHLQELPSFRVEGIEHRFIGYKIGSFDQEQFIENLSTVVKAAVTIFDDIPYKHYTFIGTGPGRGGIEHLNNTTVSFNGSTIKNKQDMIRIMNFLGHEYFHNYNVKRIRPFELGPFDYDKENRTYQLWVSEGLTVYYEYLIVRRAGIADEEVFLNNFERHINTLENNPGRFVQSLSQSSYNTWDEGPFGGQGENKNKTISYYNKGPIVGLLLDFTIRNATRNKKSLDDVMRLLYCKYYKKLERGFTAAEFQQDCESVAGIFLTHIFEYIYTTKELDYNKYLHYAGLNLTKVPAQNSQETTYRYLISRIENPDSLQSAILKSWLCK
ncbi:MAG: M61 family peptidase [bacterium]